MLSIPPKARFTFQNFRESRRNILRIDLPLLRIFYRKSLLFHSSKLHLVDLARFSSHSLLMAPHIPNHAITRAASRTMLPIRMILNASVSNLSLLNGSVPSATSKNARQISASQVEYNDRKAHFQGSTCV
jgi:hypothetical protein